MVAGEQPVHPGSLDDCRGQGRLGMTVNLASRGGRLFMLAVALLFVGTVALPFLL